MLRDRNLKRSEVIRAILLEDSPCCTAVALAGPAPPLALPALCRLPARLCRPRRSVPRWRHPSLSMRSSTGGGGGGNGSNDSELAAALDALTAAADPNAPNPLPGQVMTSPYTHSAPRNLSSARDLKR